MTLTRIRSASAPAWNDAVRVTNVSVTRSPVQTVPAVYDRPVAQGPEATAGEAPTVDRLVRAALGALNELPAATLLEAVGVREIARRAGTGTRSIYHHFTDLAGLADAVMERVFDPLAHQGGLPAAVEVDPGRTELGAMLERYRASLAHLVEDPDFALRFGLWAIGDEALQQRYVGWLLLLENSLLEDPHAIPGRDRLDPRPPMDHRGFVATYVGLRHGMAIRQVIDPHPARPDQFAMTYVAMTAALSRQPGDTHDADARLAEMNHFPLDRRRPAAAMDNPERAARRALVLDAAEALFDLHGFEGTTIEAVATAAGLGATAALDLAGGKHALAVGVVRRRIDALPQRGGTTHVDPLRSSLVDLATVALASRRFLLPFALDLALDAPGAGESVTRQLGSLVAPDRAMSLAVQLLQAALAVDEGETVPDPDVLVDDLLGTGR